MQLFFHKKCFIVHCFILAFSFCLFPDSYGYAANAVPTQDIHIEWSFDRSQNSSWDGFRLYRGNTSICHIPNSAARKMDCKFKSPNGTFQFYLATYSANGESPLSAPFSFTLKASPQTEYTTSVIRHDDSLVIAFDASGLTLPAGQTTGYTWRFDDTIVQTGARVTQSFPANRVCSISLTVTFASGAQHTIRSSTIRFLPEIHANVIYLINSLLLKQPIR